MTLEEAIKHAEEVADWMKRQSSQNDKCDKCAEEHRQLAEWLKDYKRLKESQPCEDAISRQAVKEALRNRIGESISECINALPSVTPATKMGRWEWNQYDYNPNLGNYHCSECRNIVTECVPKQGSSCVPMYKYCPNCGAKMEGVEE